MASYRISIKAKTDIENIWNYTAEQWSIRQAEIYVKLLLDEFVKISKNQNVGRNYFRIRNDYFGSKVKSHIIFYRIVNSTETEIVRILHQKMDLKSKIGEK